MPAASCSTASLRLTGAPAWLRCCCATGVWQLPTRCLADSCSLSGSQTVQVHLPPLISHLRNWHHACRRLHACWQLLSILRWNGKCASTAGIRKCRLSVRLLTRHASLTGYDRLNWPSAMLKDCAGAPAIPGQLARQLSMRVQMPACVRPVAWQLTLGLANAPVCLPCGSHMR